LGDSKYSVSSSDFYENFKAINDPDSVFYQPDKDVVFFNDSYFNGELDVMFSKLNVPFCVDEIVKAWTKLNSGKSAGSDYWLNEFFKYDYCCNGFVNVICVLFNKFFDLRYFPADWSEGFIVSLHEKGNTDDTHSSSLSTVLVHESIEKPELCHFQIWQK